MRALPVERLRTKLVPIVLAPVFALGGFALWAGEADDAELLLPDIAVDPEYLSDWIVEINLFTGREELRFPNATPNLGDGPLVVRGVLPPNEDGTQTVRQRISRRGGDLIERDAGTFRFHPTHDHMHFEAWAAYRLRSVAPDGGPGEILAESEKTSFCLADFAVYNASLPGFEPVPAFASCDGSIQGISVGWTDLYSRTVDGQSIDVTDLPAGEYWLESEVDPEDRIVESNENNNVARVRVTIGDRSGIEPDPFEPNESIAEVGARPEAAPRSPNIGPAGPELVLSNLTIHSSGDRDVFRLYSPATGSGADFIRVDTARQGPRLALRLLDSDGVELGATATVDGAAKISFAGLPGGFYYAEITALDGAARLRYSLNFHPSRNEPPSVSILAPGSGDERLPHARALYTVRWQSNDPDGNRTWVTVWLHPRLHSSEGEHLLITSRWTRGELGFHRVNTAEVDPGTYWVRCEVSDGSRSSETWSEGTITLVGFPAECFVDDPETADCDGDGLADACELELRTERDCDGNTLPDACDLRDGRLTDADGDGRPDACGVLFHRGDANADGFLDISDTVFLLSWLFAGAELPTCLETADLDDGGSIDLSDAVSGLNFLFRGGPAPLEPGPPGLPCGTDPKRPAGSPQVGCASYEACR